MLLGEVTLGLPWKCIFQQCLHHDTSLSCFSSAAERLDNEEQETYNPTEKAEATGKLLEPFPSLDLKVPFVPNEADLGTEVVSEHAVKVRQRMCRFEYAWKLGMWDSTHRCSSPKRHLLWTFFLWSGSWSLMPAFWIPKRGDISVATNRLELLLRRTFGCTSGLWILLE